MEKNDDEVDVVGGVFRDLLFYGETHARDLLEMPGGTGYNVFVGLRALNIETYFHGSIGIDWPFEKVGRVKEGKSGVFVCRDEKEVLAVYRGVNLLTEYEDMHSRVLFSTLECGGDVFEEYAKRAKKSGIMVILDPSPIFEWKTEYLELCDLILPDSEEYSVISDDHSIGIEAFVKLGSDGGMYVKNNEEYRLPVSKGGNFLLGCGDAFDVMVIYGILNGMNAYEILETAVKTGRRASFIRGSSTAVVEAIKNSVESIS